MKTAPSPHGRDVAEAPWREKTAVFEDMLGDHAAFRNQFMTLNAAFNYRLFGTVQSSEVLLGREEWLFYKNVSDSRSLDDYQGLNPYSPDQLGRIAADLSALQQLLAQRGVQLVLLVAPNKEGVYSEYMPAGVPQVGATKAQLLGAAPAGKHLGAGGVPAGRAARGRRAGAGVLQAGHPLERRGCAGGLPCPSGRSGAGCLCL